MRLGQGRGCRFDFGMGEGLCVLEGGRDSKVEGSL